MVRRPTSTLKLRPELLDFLLDHLCRRLVPNAGGLAFVGAPSPIHQDFRNIAFPNSMALGFIEGDMALLETLGFALAVLSMWFWTHC
jgi:hypothetical protein